MPKNFLIQLENEIQRAKNERREALEKRHMQQTLISDGTIKGLEAAKGLAKKILLDGQG
ncbi:hypothetical protein [Paenibacillus xylanexedens]|uniref:Uncharacterized protein n=1 Tax=Paenibacillus xylanexedens TaxID=528191 RepID=A0ABS4RPX8_PAEXY|nr:hypothetical protein [Paenibacillus xylanexedens]MBP2243827.1 hypothetical protein [Paenibacillus xylanexedens]